MKPQVDSLQLKRPNKNAFDLSHEHKLSCNMGDLIPIYIEPVLPGDVFRVKSEILMRMAPMVSPVMHRVNVYTHYFFVPERLVYNDFDDFLAGTVGAKPRIQINTNTKQGFQKGWLPDYYGLPVFDQALIPTADQYIDAGPFRAYQLIYNEYFRDQKITPAISFTTGLVVSDAEAVVIMSLRKRAWEKDYFTSALPQAQLGAEVSIPVGPIGPLDINYKAAAQFHDGSTNYRLKDVQTDSTGKFIAGVAGPTGEIRNIDGIDANVGTIRDLRRAERLQQWLEIASRAGTRMKEIIWAFFGESIPDSRLQRPEYLGGGKQPVVISEVLSTVENSDASLPQGNMAGHGISVGRSNQFNQKFAEHGWIIGIMSVLPRTAYTSQGIHRMFTKFDKNDLYWPQFANIGEQEVLSREIYYDPDAGAAANDVLFGYQSRYAEYKFKESIVSGDFRDTLEYWHMSRTFSSRPALNDNFIKSDPTHRIFAVTDPSIHKLYVQVYNDVQALRPIPRFDNPMI